MMWIIWLIISCLFLIPALYSFFIYPLFIWLLARFFPVKVNLQSSHAAPNTFSFLLPAYNEEKFITKKLDNIRALTEESGYRVEVLIFNDGSSDQTLKQIREWMESNLDFQVKVLNSKKNVGKWEGLKQLVPLATGEVTVLSDISADLPVDLLLKAAPYFKDQSIAVVSPTYDFAKGTKSFIWENLYWPYERFLKQQESLFYSTVGAHGAGYLIRTENIPNLVEMEQMGLPLINDDYLIPTLACRGGKRVHYLLNSAVSELESVSVKVEYKRRVRIALGNLYMAKMLSYMIDDPMDVQIKFINFSHKSLRFFVGPGLFFFFVTLSIWWLFPFGILPALAALVMLKVSPFRASLHALSIHFFKGKQQRW